MKGKKTLLVLQGGPSLLEVEEGEMRGDDYLRKTVVSDLIDASKKKGYGFVIDAVVRCFGNGRPGIKQVEACQGNWLGTVDKWKPDAIIALGAVAAEAVMGQKVKMEGLAGSSSVFTHGGRKIPVVINYHPGDVARALKEKGGANEKKFTDWCDAWDSVFEVMERGVAEKPEIIKLLDYKSILDFCDYLGGNVGEIAYDYETWGDRDALRPELNDDFKIACIGVAVDGKGYCFPVYRPDARLTDVQREKILKSWFRVVLLGERRLTIAQNAKYEHKCNLKQFGLSSYLKDTMLMSVVLDETKSSRLGQIAMRCGIKWAGYKNEMSDAQQNPMEVPLDQLLEYCGLDALATLISKQVMQEEFNKYPKLQKVLNMRQHFALSLAKAEMAGMCTDRGEMALVKAQLAKEMEEAKRRVWMDIRVQQTERWAEKNIKSFKPGDRFNLKSPTQVQHLLLNVMKLKVKQKKKFDPETRKVTYTPITDKTALEPFKDIPLIRDIIKIRSIESMFTGFLNKYDNFTCSKGRVHTNFSQEIVVTGRLSSTDPNLQNIPVRDKDAGGLSIIRRIFKSRFKDGWVICADYKQIEPRLIAGMSGDKKMKHALVNGLDLHRYASSVIYKVKYEDVTDIQRDYGKRMNLGTIYDQTEYGLSEKTGLTLKEAKALIDEYRVQFPDVQRFKDEKHRQARRTGMVTDLFGSRRHLPGAQSENKWEMQRAFRQGGNFPIQSTANIFCLIALWLVQEAFEAENIEAVATGTTHDSIYAECGPDVFTTMEIMRQEMLKHNEADYWKDMGVPMAVDFKYGRNLFELEEWKG